MPHARKRTKEALALALIGTSVSVGVWLVGRWRERERRWRWARETSRGLAPPESHLSPEPEPGHLNGHQIH